MKWNSLLLTGLLTACATTDQLPDSCSGETTLSTPYADAFVAIEDPALLARSLGAPKQGKLCQGQVYQLKQDVVITVYRAWNSTNPNSEKGLWWALSRPAGQIREYRSDYEICYQWSPLDKLTQCRLKAGATVVIGNGQSAKCSEYLTYGASATQQVYLENADDFVSQCERYDAEFSWQPENP